MVIKIFSDCADKNAMIEMYNNPLIKGITTNPTLMRRAGITNYSEFAKDILKIIKNKPISFEVFSDDFETMKSQALKISSWGSNIYVKIPITNTKGESTFNLIEHLSKLNININVTAVMTIKQVEHILPAISQCPSGYISVLAGRIADSGIDPLPIMSDCVKLLKNYTNLELIWASSRELYNIIQADNIGCNIITITNDIFKKIEMIGKDLDELSLDTVKMFYNDALSSGYTL